MESDYTNWHPTFPVTLKNCKDEPIHIPGAIQAFGVLVAFTPKTHQIQVISANAPKLLPKIKDFESKPVFVHELLHLHELSNNGADQKRRMVRVEILHGPRAEETFLGVTYLSGGMQVLEIETLQRQNLATDDYLADLPSMMKDIQANSGLEDLVNFAAKKIKELSGFDRVMVYQYDEEWNGEVVAEARQDNLEPFLGLHYPASDIPPQARALYEKNWIRIIPTVHYQPIHLLPEKHHKLDLSDSVMRSVSPIHIQYLKNMGVDASMSISLMVDNRLWGLIACHHYSAHHVPLSQRLGCEAYGQLLSWQIQKLTAQRELDVTNAGEEALLAVLSNFGEQGNFKRAAIKMQDQLLQIFECTGMVIRLGEESVRLGEAPDELFANAVGKSLIGRSILEPLVSKDVHTVPEVSMISHTPNAAGFMALSLAPRHNYYIICVRPEVAQTVNWAGKPQKSESLDFSDPAQRLLPRGSFALWQEIHRGQCLNWSRETIGIFKKFGLLFIKLVIERKELLEKSHSELKTLSRAKDEFVAMVSHELRTPLNAIIGWTDLALSGELPNEQIPESLRIIQRNARSQNQLINDLLDLSRIISGKMKLSVRSMRVSEVVEAVALSFTPAAEAKQLKIISNLEVNTDSILGDTDRVQQVIWNLLSNAVKFSPKGKKIWLNVHRTNSHIEMRVKDEGIGLEPDNLDKIFGRFEQVDSSFSRRAGGLGLGLAISRHIVELHGGSISVQSEGLNMGTTFIVLFPIAPTFPAEKSEMPIDDELSNRSPKYVPTSKRLANEVILIVEDEPDASQFLELLIAANGAKTFTAHNGVEALKILNANKGTIGIILSDVGMPVMDGLTLMQSIRADQDKAINSICAVALTAYGRPQDRIACLRSGFDSYISKPVLQEELLTVLESACKTKKR